MSHITDKVQDIKPHHDFHLRHSAQLHFRLPWQESLRYSFRELGGSGERPETEVMSCLVHMAHASKSM